MGEVLIGGVRLSWREHGEGPPLLLLHESAASGAIWDPLVAALGTGVRSIVPDRRGWGASDAPQPYVATTVEEQAADAEALLAELDPGAAIACGSGLGAVVALELLLRHGDRVKAAVAVEPPLLAFVPEATEGLGADRQALSDAVAEGGAEAVTDLYLAGGMPFLGPGAERIPDEVGAEARRRPRSLFAELGAVPAWALRGAEMRALRAPARVVVGSSTPPTLALAAQQLADRLGSGELVELDSGGLPHVTGAAELAGVVADLL